MHGLGRSGPRSRLAKARFEFEGRRSKSHASAGLAQLQKGETVGRLSSSQASDDSLYHARKRDEIEACGTTARRAFRWCSHAKHRMRTGRHEPEWMAGMSNNAAFREEVKRRVAEWKRGGPTVSLAVLRIDGWLELVAGKGPEWLTRSEGNRSILKASVRCMDNIANLGDGTVQHDVPKCSTREHAEDCRASSLCNLAMRSSDQQGRTTFSVSIGVTETCSPRPADSSYYPSSESANTRLPMKVGNACMIHDGDQTSA